MKISLEFVENDTVEAVVTDRPAASEKKGSEKEVWVRFFVDGKRKRAVKTEGGIASLELKNLKPGSHTVFVEVVGDSAHDEGELEIRPRTTGPLGIAAMVIFWLAMILVSWEIDTLPLITGYLGLTAVTLWIIALVKRVPFGAILRNNNWVFFANAGMLVVSFVMAFVGESWMWSDMALQCLVALPFALLVSFWDEGSKFLGKLFAHLGKGESLANFALKDALMELLFGIFKKRG